MTIRAQLLFLILASLAIFYPAFSADISTIDDTLLIERLEKSQPTNPLSVFVRKNSTLLYYRPILGITFWIDKNIFNVSPFWMHTENVLIHLSSMILIFFIARFLLVPQKSASPLLPFFSSLLWGLHPLTAESVNWISGRTDLLAGIFIFAATLLLLHFRDTRKIRLLIFAALASLCAMLSKEVAVAFVPGALLILSSKSVPRLPVQKSKNLLLFSFTVATITIPLFLFFIIRTVASISNSSRIGITFLYLKTNPIHSLMLFLRDIGFYIKKIFIPWPLNLAIMDVDPLYDLFAILIILFCIWLLWKRSLSGAFFLTGIFLLTPSFLIVLNQIAWTPFAERYIYISSAFILLSLMGFLAQYNNDQFQKTISTIIPIVIIIFSISTLHRSTIWHSNFKMLEDTAQKSPFCKKIQRIYGFSLLRRGNYAAAEYVTQKARRLQGSPFEKDYITEINLGIIYLKQHRIHNALKLFEEISRKKNHTHGKALKGIIISSSKLAKTATQIEDENYWYDKVVKNSILLYDLQKDPTVWYELGKLSLALHKDQQARIYFNKAYKAFPDSSPYKEFSKKLSLK